LRFSSHGIYPLSKLPNAELTGGFSRITSAERLAIWEVLPVERLVRKARSAEKTKRKTGEASQLGVPQGASRLEERPPSPVGRGKQAFANGN